MPLIAFILLAVICLALLGFACACLSDHPTQAIDKAVASGQALPPVIEVWSVVLLLLVGAGLLIAVENRARQRASPAFLQRFLL